MHTGLLFYQDHRLELETLIEDQRNFARLAAAVADNRETVIQVLQITDVDVVYFYCHAQSESDVEEAFIEFYSTVSASSGRITTAQFRAITPKWVRTPLVILNGCQSVAGDAFFPSQFISAFVNDHGAGGVLGTCVNVREILACEFARLFLTRYLQGIPAGAALRASRLELLGKKNPLGLNYTLFAPLELCLERNTASGPIPLVG